MTDKEKANKAKAKYLREWRAKNKDKVKKHNERYWLKRAEEQQEERKGG